MKFLRSQPLLREVHVIRSVTTIEG